MIPFGEIELPGARAREALERWDVATARREAEVMRASAAGWGSAEGVLNAELLLTRAALLTCADPAQLDHSRSPLVDRVASLHATWQRLQAELCCASVAPEPLPKPACVTPDSLPDQIAATALVALRRLELSSPLPQRLIQGAWTLGEDEPSWWHLLAALEAEQRGGNGIELLEPVIRLGQIAGKRALAWAALGAKACFCERRGARDAALKTQRQRRELLEDWLLVLPASEAMTALARPDRVHGTGSDVAADRSSSPLTATLLEKAVEISQERDDEQIVKRALEAAIVATGAERGLLLLSDEHGKQRVAATRHMSDDGAEALLGLSSTIARIALVQGDAVVCEDVRSDSRFSDCESLAMGVVSVLCAPIHARGQLEGAIYLDCRQRGRPFAPSAVAAARVFGSLVAASLLNVRTIAALETRTRELEALRNELDVALAARTIERDDMGRRLAQRDDVTPAGADTIVGGAPAMIRLRRLLQTVAASDAPVLILGETGVGKELVARAVHAASTRRDKPFIAVNCASLSEQLLAAELFGFVRGAFTGATATKPGLFVAADQGTLFLDEVGDMPPAMQRALLRALETGDVLPIGSTEARRVNVRVLAATHRDLAELSARGTFREDLRFRLEVVRLEVPPLRERLEDLPELCESLLMDVQRRYTLPARHVSAEALAALASRSWPGNVRELRHVLAAAALNTEGPTIRAEDLPRERDVDRTSSAGVSLVADVDGHGIRLDAIRRALRATAGHRGRAAKLLGISRSTLYRYCETYGVETKQFDRRNEPKAANAAPPASPRVGTPPLAR